MTTNYKVIKYKLSINNVSIFSDMFDVEVEVMMSDKQANTSFNIR